MFHVANLEQDHITIFDVTRNSLHLPENVFAKYWTLSSLMVEISIIKRILK